MKILVFIPSLYATSPASRFRIEQWAHYLERDGFQFTFRSFEDPTLHQTIYRDGMYTKKMILMLKAYARRIGDLSLVKQHDVVFIYEESTRIGPAVIEWLIRRTGTPIIYDFCDPIYVPYKSPVNKYLSYLKWFSKCSRICEMSTHVIVGNKYLGDYARRHNPNVSVIPITIDTQRYTVKDPSPTASEEIVIGWSGSVTTLQHLEPLRDVLGKLSKFNRVKIKIIGRARPDWLDVPHTFVDWSEETEVAELQSFDIGIMPLPNDHWTRLRTQLKVRQYMGVGVPTVASPVGILPEIIQDGENGFLATTPQQWFEKLSRLVRDAQLRRRLGLAGRKSIEKQCSTEVWVPELRKIFESAAARKGTARRKRIEAINPLSAASFSKITIPSIIEEEPVPCG